MTGVQVFLMAFGAILALIGVVVFFLLAWFKETTGQDQHNAIKILQAEFRFSNPSLVIFAGGLLLMVAPFFIGSDTPSAPPPTPTPAIVNAAPPVVAANPTPTPTPRPTVVPAAVEPATTEAPTPLQQEPTPTATPTTVPTKAPTPTVPVASVPDPTGRWRNQSGFVEFRRISSDSFTFADFDTFGSQVGQGTATQDEEFLYLSGEGYLFDGFGNPYYIAYTGDMTIDGEVLQGDLYDTFGTYLGSVLFTRDAGGLGQ